MAEFGIEQRVDYTRYSNRQLAAVPLALIVVSLVVIAGWYVTTGSPVNPGIDFTGGTELVITTASSRAEIASAFEQQPTSIQGIRGQADSYIVTFQGRDVDVQSLSSQAVAALEPVGPNTDIVGLSQEVDPSFGAETQRNALLGIVVAFLGMSVVAFVLFRTFVPSVAIVISAFGDIVVPIALMDLLGITFSLGTVAALLMLIGYSVDSDILLTNHVLRRSGGFYESTYRAMRTGVTMTLTSISAMIVMAIVAYFFGIELLASIGLVLFFGLTVDLMNTYLLNLSLLRWYRYEGVAR